MLVNEALAKFGFCWKSHNLWIYRGYWVGKRCCCCISRAILLLRMSFIYTGRVLWIGWSKPENNSSRTSSACSIREEKSCVRFYSINCFSNLSLTIYCYDCIYVKTLILIIRCLYFSSIAGEEDQCNQGFQIWMMLGQVAKVNAC